MDGATEPNSRTACDEPCSTRPLRELLSQPTLELSDPLVLLANALLQALNLLVHPQQHGDNRLAALVIDRLGLLALHTPTFAAAGLRPPNRPNGYENARVRRGFGPIRGVLGCD